MIVFAGLIYVIFSNYKFCLDLVYFLQQNFLHGEVNLVNLKI